MLDAGLLAVGCLLLYVGADQLIKGAAAIGQRLRFSPTVTGLLLVAVGTSLPELAVALDAALHSQGNIAVGSVIGSNIVNVTIVLGAALALRALPTSRGLRQWDLPLLCAITALTIWCAADGLITRWEGLALLVTLGVCLVLRLLRSGPPSAPDVKPVGSMIRNTAALLGGVLLLVAGAEAMLAGGVGLAQLLGVSEAIIALTVVALGTGVPEIAATLAAALRGHHAMAIGNIVGSNLMNLGLVLGLSALVTPLYAPDVGWLPLLTMGATALGLWLLLGWRRNAPRWAGGLLLSAFAVYQTTLL